MSFLLDPGLLVATGVGIGALAPDETSASVAEAGTMALFWGVSTSLWQDRRWIAWAPPLLGSESGRDFMLNSGKLNLGVPLHFDAAKRGRRREVVAAVVFATYPVWLHLGRRLGRALRARVQREPASGSPALGTTEHGRQESVL
ncbi:MAG: hypothetical protein K1X95_04100 [Acidimicrobiia bacterium]|nr:hypothetical protein [Acidimicrobiia bacterium]